jgi:hypothetical protein
VTTALKQRRDRTIAKLLELSPEILRGSASETYRTCGNPNCRCHGEGPKHGPHMYVNYKAEDGPKGYYVPVALQKRVRDGLTAWRTAGELLKDIAQLNKDIMDAERPKTTRRKRT